jgi:hypothetical protein
MWSAGRQSRRLLVNEAALTLRCALGKGAALHANSDVRCSAGFRFPEPGIFIFLPQAILTFSTADLFTPIHN